jgi:hypothetical protein
MTTIRWVASLAVAVALTGCGSAASPPTSGPPSRRPPATTTADPALWTRHDAPPDGVPRQLDYYGVGDEVCGPLSPGPPRVDLDRYPYYQTAVPGDKGPVEPEIGETVILCPRGFTGAGRIALTVRRADGRTYRTTVPAKGNQIAGYFLDATWPTGAIDVTARQGDTVARAHLTAILPRRHGVRVSEVPGPGHPGPFSVVMVGEKPSSRVTLDVYRWMGKHFNYITSVRAHSDARGIARLRLGFAKQVHGQFLLRSRSGGMSPDRDLIGGVSRCRNAECT